MFVGRVTLLAEVSRGLQPVDYLVVLAYIVGVLGVGLYLARNQRGGEDYFLAGREMPWFAVGLSVVATLLSTLTYLAAPGELIQYGVAMSVGWLTLPFAFVLTSFFWLPFFMRLRLTSVYEYLEMRFGLTARWLGAGMFVFILRLFWMALIILTASRAVASITYASAHEASQTFLSVSFTAERWDLSVLLAVGLLATLYTVLGGIKAVIWTDVAQFVVLSAGAVLTLIFVAQDTNTGPIDWWHTVTAGGKDGHQLPPLASWDITVRNTILWTSLHTFFWYACTFLGDQVALQRYFTTPSVGAAIRCNMVNFAADFAIMLLLAMCGMALLTYYLEFPTEIIAGISDPRDPLVADRIFPHFIEHGLPVGVSGLVVAALFAVAMSSIDSGINSVSTVITIDVVRRLRPELTTAGELRLARWLTLAIGGCCTGLALWLMQLPEEYNIISVTARTFNCALGPLGALFLVGMFLPHVGERAVVIAALIGLATAVTVAWWTELFWMLGIIDAKSLVEAIEIAPGPTPFLVTPIAATTTVVLAAALGALFPSPDRDRVRPLTWKAVVRGS